MIKLLFSVVLIILNVPVQAAGIGNIFNALVSRSGTLGQEASVDQALVKVSAQMNRRMPVEVDKDTRLDKVSAEPGQQLTYHYTLTSIRSSEVNADEFQRLAKPQLKTRLCNSREMQNFLKSGVTVSYAYRGNDGRGIGQVKFAPSECGYKS
jgi:hypothetical protein